MENDIQNLIIAEFQNFEKRITQLIPKVDTELVLQILKYQTMNGEWPGSVILRIKYQRNLESDINTKKEKLYERYKMLPTEVDERTLRFKTLGVYINDINELSQDPEVEHISGSAEPSQKDQYPSAQ